MKRIFEILLVTFLLFIILYFLLYIFYFNYLCNKYSGKDEQSFAYAINKIAKCKDSLVCNPINIETNNRNEVNNWDCVKKDSRVFGLTFYINIFKHFINSIKK